MANSAPRSIRNCRWLVLAVLVVAGIGTSALGQTAARPDRGFTPTGSYSVTDIESVSLSNGNLHLSIPLAALPPVSGGRLGLTLRASYNSKLWDMARKEYASNVMGMPNFTQDKPQLSLDGGWRIGAGYTITRHDSREDFDWVAPFCGQQPCSENECGLLTGNFFTKVVLTTPDGATHELRPLDYAPYQMSQQNLWGYYTQYPDNICSSPQTCPPAGCTIGEMRYYSFDGSFIWAKMYPKGNSKRWEIYLSDGTRIKQRSNGIQEIDDSTGLNTIQMYSTTDAGNPSWITTHFVDLQTGREFKYVTDATGEHIQYQTVGGTWMSIDIVRGQTSVFGKTYTVQDQFIGGGECERQELFGANVEVIRQIVFPSTEPGQPGRRFTFNYNSDGTPVPYSQSWKGHCEDPDVPLSTASPGWGELSQMQTPSGATVTYAYNLDSVHRLDGTAFENNDLPRAKLVTKTLDHDGINEVWNYTSGEIGGSVSGPDGSVTTETSYVHDPAYSFIYGGEDGLGGLVYKTNYSNKVIVERRWALKKFSGANDIMPGSLVHPPFNPVVEAEFTTIVDPTDPTKNKMSAKFFQYDYNGNLTQETDYDSFLASQVSRDDDAFHLPNAVPGGVAVLRTTTTSYYNPAPVSSDPNSPNVYSRRLLATATPKILSAPRTSVVGPSQTEFYYDGSLELNTPPVSGNLTKERRWEGTKWIETTHAYDSLTANRTSTTDPKFNVTQFFYDATKALPSSVVVDPQNSTGQQSTSTVYDFATGLPTSATDANGRTASSSYINQLTGSVDPFARPGIGTDPQGRKTVTRYFDNARQTEVWSDLNSPFDAKLRSRASADQLGRPIKTESSEDGSSYAIFADTVYQQAGRITITTNPMRAGAAATDGWTRITKDDAGRVVTVETLSGRYPSGTATGVVSTSYNANATTVTDQAGKLRRSLTDGLGRLVRVDEPNAAGSLGPVDSPTQPTSYTYDSRNNLTQVVQGGQSRSFVYDGLSRLKQATNPESGSINYTYYDNSNLETKTDARGVVTTYAYDGLNRVTSRTYSGPGPGGTTPTVTYVYDTLGMALNGKGRLTSVSSSVSSYSYGSYDVMGRLLTGTQTTDGNTYSMSYQYNLAGGMTSETYPSGRVISTGYDSGGRLSSVNGQKTGESNRTYGSQLSYAAHGAPASMTLGNNLVEGTTFNSRLQPSFIKLGTTGNPTSVLQLGYEYTSACQTGNNGNVMRQTITAPGLSLTQDYCYDSLNRLSSATESNGASWSQTYGYDRWGNRWVSASTGYTLNSLTPTSAGWFNTANNRFAPGFGLYDNAGNLNTDVQNRAFTYDGENRQITFNGTAGQYFYDGDGRRVKKIDGGGTTIFVYNAGGQMMAEYHSDPVPPAAGGGGTSYLTTDHLGSTRVVTKQDGTVKARYDYLPFGEELGSGIGGRTVGMGYSGADSTKQKFTQKERDSESLLDYFLARYYSSAQGRFTSVDPENAGATTDDAQSWNGYAYARNSPAVFMDPDGLKYVLFIDGGYSTVDDWLFHQEQQKYQRYGFTFSGTGDCFESGSILDEEGKFVGNYAQISIDDVAQRFKFEMSRRAPASLELIDWASLSLLPIEIISGTAVMRGGVHGLGFLGPIIEPKGSKLGQMISRFARIGGERSRSGFMRHAKELVSKAVEAGTYVHGRVGSEVGAKIFRVGDEYLVVSRTGKLLSYVEKGYSDGGGIVGVYRALGGK